MTSVEEKAVPHQDESDNVRLHDTVEVENFTCNSCGAYLTIDAAFCQNCGSRVGGKSNAVPIELHTEHVNINVAQNSFANENSTYKRISTRWTYAYFALAYFWFEFFSMLISFTVTFYASNVGSGISIFFGSFIPSCIGIAIFITDFRVWIKNRKTATFEQHSIRDEHGHQIEADSTLVMDLSCCGGCCGWQWSKSMIVNLWAASFGLRIFFGILIGLPSGALSLATISLIAGMFDIVFFVDFLWYYSHSYFNGVFGLFYNPWHFVIWSCLTQAIFCWFVVFLHFWIHYECIEDPGSDHDICYDWIPYELLLFVYCSIFAFYTMHYFKINGLTHRFVDSYVRNQYQRYFLWGCSLAIVACIIWLVVEFFDAHFYAYDVTAFFLMWFVCPLAWTLATKFKVRGY